MMISFCVAAPIVVCGEKLCKRLAWNILVTASKIMRFVKKKILFTIIYRISIFMYIWLITYILELPSKEKCLKIMIGEIKLLIKCLINSLIYLDSFLESDIVPNFFSESGLLLKRALILDSDYSYS